MAQQIVGTFEIPEELAKELSDLLTKQTIRMQVLTNVIDQPDKYEIAEKNLIPITRKIEAIKVKITKEYVPDKYDDPKYVWNYDGWDVSENKVQIITA